MLNFATAGPAVLAAFLASTVEFVEAFTIILAVSVVRGWRPALTGAVAGLALLLALVVIFGPLLELVPINVLQLAIGLLLMLFGLRWLRKAILRQAGFIALHDEASIFARQEAALRSAEHEAAQDWVAGLASFKAVVLEGLEVIFIVIAVGSSRGLLIPASLGALAALILVMVAGYVLHRPLSKVPENGLKFGVGVLLSAFGVFWAGEGMGVPWPGQDLIILALIILFLFTALGTVRVLQRRKVFA
jgi:uncharacterized membrane protein